MAMEGYATMYMRMPMSSSSLPIQGSCTVQDKLVTLKFPFTGIEFELPKAPQEEKEGFEFRIRGARGDMTLTIGYNKDLKCYHGVGKQEDDTPVITFVFYESGSAMSQLPKY